LLLAVLRHEAVFIVPIVTIGAIVLVRLQSLPRALVGHFLQTIIPITIGVEQLPAAIAFDVVVFLLYFHNSFSFIQIKKDGDKSSPPSVVGGPTACTGTSGALPDVMFSGAYPPVSLSL
jgi:hypothetical protein